MAESLIKLECNLAEAFESNEKNTLTLEILSSLDKEIELLDAEIIDISSMEEIRPDKWDTTIAVASGVLTGLIDSFFVGEFDLTKASEWGKEKTENFVKKFAKMKGYKGDTVRGAVSKMEKVEMAGDKVMNCFGGSKYHHFKDFSHYPNIIGLICSLVTQFTGFVLGTNKEGAFQAVCVPIEKREGIIGKNIGEKILFGTVNWFFHLVSDMAGSSSTAGKTGGMGLPGPILSFAKMVSAALVGFADISGNKDVKIGIHNFADYLTKFYDGRAIKDENGEEVKLDFRTEIGILAPQSLPVLINEGIVKAFCLIRSFVEEIKRAEIHSFAEIKKIDLKKAFTVSPQKMADMMTLATFVFCAVDFADAAIRGLIESKGTSLWLTCALKRVNVVGASKFAISLGNSVVQNVKKELKSQEKYVLTSKRLHLLNAKLFYKQELVWEKTKETQESIDELAKVLERVDVAIKSQYAAIEENIRAIQALELTKETQELLIEELDI